MPRPPPFGPEEEEDAPPFFPFDVVRRISPALFDRFELLEHTLFWFITMVSWVVYNKLEVDTGDELHLSRAQKSLASIVALVLVIVTSASIFSYNEDYFYLRTTAIESVQVGDNLYKVSFPFLGGSTVFEGSVQMFKDANPAKQIVQIYTVPNQLRLKKADSLIFYIVTEDK